MDSGMLLGIWRAMVRIPSRIWQKQMSRETHGPDRLAFMSEDHHRVRDFVVTELPRAGQPLPPPLIAQRLGLPLEKVVDILDELERNMVFLFRNEQGAVVWAYPVTAETTPHRITFGSGEQIYAA
jgi:hypothetical protein